MGEPWGTEPDRLAQVLTALRRPADEVAVVVVEGPLGAGRSTLLQAVERELRRTVPAPAVLRARGSPQERGIPGGVARQLLRGQAVPDDVDVERVSWSLADVAEAHDGGLLITVDDADHADDAS